MKVNKPCLRLFVMAVLALFPAGCESLNPFSGDEEVRLEGERISILSLQSGLEPDDVALEGEGFVAPDAWTNEFWPQAGGYPNHAMQNLQLSEDALSPVWQSRPGAGGSEDRPLTAGPVIFDGVLYMLDSDSVLHALSAGDGSALWEIALRPKGEDESVIPGGVAYSGGTVFATSGYNEVLAIDPGAREILWRQPLPAASRAAPTVANDSVYVATMDNRLLAFSAEDGSPSWRHTGLQEMAGLVGAASPAANRDVVVPVYSSGEIFALRVENGSVAWSDNLAPLQRLGGLGGISDIRAMPVIDEDIVVSISYGGRLVALDVRSGARIWQREIGGSEMPWVAGNHIFIITNGNEMAALGRDTGAVRWVTPLPGGEEEDDSPAIWTGPVLAGGRLIAAASDGRIREINPADGALIREWETGTDIVQPPIVANRMLYLVAENGTVLAYR